MHKFSLIFIIISILLMSQAACNRNSIGPQSPVLELTAERVESIEVALALKTTDASALGDFEIHRDGARWFSGRVAKAETTVIDTTVLPARKYVYQASRRVGGATQKSNMFTVTTMDTNSHNYRWAIQTIGVFQSSLSDVWGSSPADVYAVGRVEVPNGQTQSNIIHFDGTSWRTVTEAAFDTGFVYGEFGGVYGFSPNDVWVVGTNVLHWDSSKWKPFAFTLRRTGPNSGTVITLDQVLHGNYFSSIWGTSSNNLFAVGDKGVIVHYDGQKWTKMESGTDLTFFDVWGSSSTDVYAVAMDFFSARWIVVHYDGTAWRPVVADFIQLNRPRGVWGANQNNVYIASDFVFRFNGIKWKRLQVPNMQYNMGGVEGSSANNIFVVGSFGVVLHWNGATWKRYDELLKPEGGRLLQRLWTNGQEVFVVGSSQAEGVILHGKKF